MLVEGDGPGTEELSGITVEVDAGVVVGVDGAGLCG